VNRAVFFDRDGVINPLIERPNGSLTSPWNINEMEIYSSTPYNMSRLKDFGFLVFIVTNQPGIADGDMTSNELRVINENLMDKLEIDGILCALRKHASSYKPSNGMLESTIEKYNIDRNESWMIGDRWKDIKPANDSRIKSILLHSNATTDCSGLAVPDYESYNISGACEIIIGEMLTNSLT